MAVAACSVVGDDTDEVGSNCIGPVFAAAAMMSAMLSVKRVSRGLGGGMNVGPPSAHRATPVREIVDESPSTRHRWCTPLLVVLCRP